MLTCMQSQLYLDAAHSRKELEEGQFECMQQNTKDWQQIAYNMLHEMGIVLCVAY